MNGWVNTLKAPITVITEAKNSDGESIGKVTRQNRLHAVVPSILEASMIAGLMLFRPAASTTML